MRATEFWRERETGEIWAVELEDGLVTGCHGPLHWSEVNPTFLREGYDYAADEARELEERRAEFEPLDELTVIQIAGSVD
jgi:hypothetical protein